MGHTIRAAMTTLALSLVASLLFMISPASAVTTFGKTDIGTSSAAGAADRLRATKFTAPAGCTSLDDISAYMDRTAGGSGFAVSAAVYQDSSGVPGALVAGSSVEIASNVTQNAPQWYPTSGPAYPATKPAITPGNSYWLAIHMAKSTVNYYDSTAGNGRQVDSAYASGRPDPWGGTGDTAQTRTYSIFATCTPSPRVIEPSSITQGSSSADGSSFTTAVFEPEPRTPYVVFLEAASSSALPATPTVSGGGITYSLVPGSKVDITTSCTCRSGYLFVGSTGLPTPLGGEEVTIGFGASTITALNWHVVELTGADPSAPVVQSATGSGSGTTSHVATLSSFADATNNATVVFDGTNLDPTTRTLTPEAGYTEAGTDEGEQTPNILSAVATKLGEDTSPSYTSSINASYGIIAAEIRAAPTLVSDSFNRSNSSSSIGTADTGEAWTNVLGTWGISSNKAYLATPEDGNDWAKVDPGVADFTIEVDITLSTTRANAGVVFRQTTSDQTYLFVKLEKTTEHDRLSIMRNVNDVGSHPLTVGAEGLGLSLGSTYHLKVTIQGYDVTAKVYSGGSEIDSLQYTLVTDHHSLNEQTTYTGTPAGLRLRFDDEADDEDDGTSTFDNLVIY